MSEILITQDELQTLTQKYIEENKEKDRDELLEEWFHWFKKNAPRYIKDSMKKGLFHANFPIYRFEEGYAWEGKTLWKRIREMLPGCKLELYEEEDKKDLILEISWSSLSSV